MTLRRRVLARRGGVDEALSVNVELWAASMLAGFWLTAEMRSVRWWQSWAMQHGERIEAKVRRSCPGTRPGWWYAVRRLPPVPLLGEAPGEQTGWYRWHVDIGGVRHWRLGERHDGGRWQVCQAEHLRAIGEVDGAEWTRYRAWKRAGFPCDEYRLDEFPDKPGGYMVHLCY